MTTRARQRSAQEQWQRELEQSVQRGFPFSTVSGRPVSPLYTPDDLPQLDYDRDLGYPGQFPFTRGIYASMYRGRLWTMRQFAGYGTAEETNTRFRFLLQKGQTGLSTAFDLPTLMGVDSDDPRAAGEVGRLGVAVDTVSDMERLFEGIDLGRVSVSMTINAPAAIVLAFFLVVAERQGVGWEPLRGTIQNDILKEYHAQNEFIFPPRDSVRLVVDTIEFCTQHVPRFHPISISGYHIREAGSTATGELAFTLADGFHYVEQCLERGLAVDSFAPRLSFFFNAHNDFFEEVAKYRAARRLWARTMREKYGAREPRSWQLRFHAQTAGCTLQAEQPEVNIARVAYQALAAVLGGCQSLHTNSMDETLALPSEKAVTLALRTQQVLAHETGVTHTADPLGGSYYVETLTHQLERDAEDYLRRIDRQGGMVAAIENGFFRREIAEAAFRYQQEVESNQRTIVGVNAFQEPQKEPIPLLEMDPTTETRQKEALARFKQSRDAGAVQRSLDQLRRQAASRQNLMPALLEAARVGATIGETVNALASVFGRYEAGTG